MSLASVGHGQTGGPGTGGPGADLAQLAAAAKETVQSVTPSAVQQARVELVDAVHRLDGILSAGGSNGAAWRPILKWTVLQEQLAKGEQADLVALTDVLAQFSTDWRGLELSYFTEVRSKLRRYIDLASFSANAQGPEQVKKQLDVLATELADYSQKRQSETGRLIGRRLGFLQRTNQAGPLVQAVRQRFGQPNLYVQASRHLLDAGVSRPVDEMTPFEEDILGTWVVGCGRTVGTVGVRLCPCDGMAKFELVMSGCTHANSVGYNGPVSIDSTSVTRLTAVKPVLLDWNGLVGLPPYSSANTDSSIHDITANRGGMIGRFIEKTAWKRAGKQQGASEEEGARKAERRASQRIDSQTAPQLADANSRFHQRVRNPLIRRDELPQQVHFSTTAHHLHVAALQANLDQLGAPNSPPPVAGDHDMAVRVHESWAGNFASGLLAGETFTEARVQKLAKDLTGQIPEKLQSKQDQDPWSITFDKVDPVTLSFADNSLKVTIRGRKYTSGERELPAMNVGATYKVERQGATTRLVRQGDLDIAPPGHAPGKAFTADQIALRTLLRKRFDSLFEPVIVGQGIQPKGEWAKIGKLELAEISLQDGWAALGYKSVSGGSPVVSTATTVAPVTSAPAAVIGRTVSDRR